MHKLEAIQALSLSVSHPDIIGHFFKRTFPASSGRLWDSSEILLSNRYDGLQQVENLKADRVMEPFITCLYLCWSIH